MELEKKKEDVRGFYPSLVISFVAAAIIVYAAVLKFSNPSPPPKGLGEAKPTILEEISDYEEPSEDAGKPGVSIFRPEAPAAAPVSPGSDQIGAAGKDESGSPEKREEPAPRIPHQEALLNKGRDLHQSGKIDSAAQEWGRLVTSREQRDSYTVQLLLACKRETLSKAFKNAREDDELYYVRWKYKEQTCYKLCMGIYKSRSEAEANRLSLPAYFTGMGNRPLVIPVSKLSEGVVLK